MAEGPGATAPNSPPATSPQIRLRNHQGRARGEGSTVTDAPEVISVTSGEALLDLSGEAAGFVLQVRDCSRGYYGDGSRTLNETTLSTPELPAAAGDGPAGWQLVSADPYPVDGAFTFSWESAAGFALFGTLQLLTCRRTT